MKCLRRLCDETHKDIKHKGLQRVHEKGRMRRVPDLLPVSLQNILYRRQPELRKGEITLQANRKAKL